MREEPPTLPDYVFVRETRAQLEVGQSGEGLSRLLAEELEAAGFYDEVEVLWQNTKYHVKHNLQLRTCLLCPGSSPSRTQLLKEQQIFATVPTQSTQVGAGTTQSASRTRCRARLRRCIRSTDTMLLSATCPHLVIHATHVCVTVCRPLHAALCVC